MSLALPCAKQMQQAAGQKIDTIAWQSRRWLLGVDCLVVDGMMSVWLQGIRLSQDTLNCLGHPLKITFDVISRAFLYVSLFGSCRHIQPA